jgi:predicted dehydrogenase
VTRSAAELLRAQGQPIGDVYLHREQIAERVAELGRAIAERRPHRATGAHAAHVVEIIEAIGTSIAEGRPVDVHSSFLRPTLPPPADEMSGNGHGAQARPD